MAFYYSEPSHTFSEYLLVPGYTSAECVPDRVSLKTPLVRYRRGQEECPLSLNIPMVSAIMQSVSNDTLAIALAKEGGLSFIYGSQSIESEAAMVRRVKTNKAGFVVSASNLTPDHTLADVLALKEKNGFSTVAITEDATPNGKLLGIVTSRDYRVTRMSPDLPVREFMTPREKLITAPAATSLKEANNIIWDHKLNSLPIVDEEDHLLYFVFRKDYAEHKEHPLALQDADKRYCVGAGINSRDYAERVPALVEAGADVLCIDSSEGYSFWQKNTIDWIRERYGDSVKRRRGQRRRPRRLPLPRRVRRRLREGRHRRRLHLHHPRDQGHRPRAGDGAHRGGRRARRILPTKRASMSPSAPTAASSTTITSRSRWPWARTS